MGDHHVCLHGTPRGGRGLSTHTFSCASSGTWPSEHGLGWQPLHDGRTGVVRTCLESEVVVRAVCHRVTDGLRHSPAGWDCTASGATVFLNQWVTGPTSFPRLQVYGDKDADGFYRGETCARLGLIPCNMVSEIQADDEEMVDQLLRQGFLPLNTPVEKIGETRPCPYCPCYRAVPTITHISTDCSSGHGQRWAAPSLRLQMCQRDSRSKHPAKQV